MHLEAYTIRLPNTTLNLVDNYAAEFMSRRHSECGFFEVTTQSPIKHRRYVEQMARYFKQEHDYDFTQFCSLDDDESDEDEYSAWLFVAYAGVEWPPVSKIFGACCFRRRDLTEPESPWELQWVWLHTFFRNHGCLTNVWPFFRERFGNIMVEPPHTKAMSTFLKKWSSHNIKIQRSGP
mgnify:CR=1 FL=1